MYKKRKIENGMLDEIRIWNYARSQTELSLNMSRMLNGNESGLVGYWRCDDGTGQFVTDSSINNNDGQLGLTSGSESSDAGNRYPR